MTGTFVTDVLIVFIGAAMPVGLLRRRKNQKAVELFQVQRLRNLVAGTGFEPVTFGL
jgi:hypothetical protein